MGDLLNKRRYLSDETLRRYRDEKINNPTYAEIECMRALKQLQFKYFYQCIVAYYILDFVLQEYNCVLEVDGYTHDTKDEADEKRDRFLEQQGFKCYRLSNEDIDIESLLKLDFRPEHPNAILSRINRINQSCGHYSLIMR